MYISSVIPTVLLAVHVYVPSLLALAILIINPILVDIILVADTSCDNDTLCTDGLAIALQFNVTLVPSIIEILTVPTPAIYSGISRHNN